MYVRPSSVTEAPVDVVEGARVESVADDEDGALIGAESLMAVKEYEWTR